MSNTDNRTVRSLQKGILYLFTRTPLHVGAGSSIGAIDQPVQRERHTRFPIIPGSSIKGVLRDYLLRRCEQFIDEIFGKGSDKGDASAGVISFGEAKLLLFPIRSAKGSFALATSPLALRRFSRDSGINLPIPVAPDDMHCLSGDKVTFAQAKAVVLEEYRFTSDGDFPKDWQELLMGLLKDEVLEGAGGRFVLLSDGDMTHFALSACQVNQHVRIDSETGTAEDGGLFNEETVPSETLFYSVLSESRVPKDEHQVFEVLSKEHLIQFGGNSTTGLGFCTVKFAPGKEETHHAKS